MDEVGKKFREGMLFVTEMLMAARSMKAGVELLRSYRAGEKSKPKGTIIISAVKGGLHDIGKNLMSMIKLIEDARKVEFGGNRDRIMTNLFSKNIICEPISVMPMSYTIKRKRW